jgi:hypothetical protein
MKKVIFSLIVILLAGTAQATQTFTATALVICKDDKKVEAKASGNGARAIATCGDVVKPAHKRVKAAGQSQDNAAVVKALAESNVALRIKTLSQQGLSRFAEEGKVYSDEAGNTNERHTAGSRMCEIKANGVVQKIYFVEGDKYESKRACDLLATKWLAGTYATSPDGRTSVNVDVPPATSAPSTTSGNGNHTCELKFKGQVVETKKVDNESQCPAWAEQRAKDKGWIRAPQT